MFRQSELTNTDVGAKVGCYCNRYLNKRVEAALELVMARDWRVLRRVLVIWILREILVRSLMEIGSCYWKL